MALYQEAVEKYVELAEKALPGLKSTPAGEVDETVRTPLFELACLLATVVQPQILRPCPTAISSSASRSRSSPARAHRTP